MGETGTFAGLHVACERRELSGAQPVPERSEGASFDIPGTRPRHSNSAESPTDDGGPPIPWRHGWQSPISYCLGNCIAAPVLLLGPSLFKLDDRFDGRIEFFLRMCDERSTTSDPATSTSPRSGRLVDEASRGRVHRDDDKLGRGQSSRPPAVTSRQCSSGVS